ncbi:MAG: ABC transporter permease [Pirellulaceae bacterium]
MSDQAKNDLKPAGPSIELVDLSVKAGERTLLTDVNLTLPGGRISIVVGPSGVGKSIALKIIGGLISKRYDGISTTGQVLIGKQPVSVGEAGVVFQSFALLDELSPLGNVDFAYGCSKHAGSEQRTPEQWLTELNVPQNVPTSRLSGGQRQRLAIARTLAADPPILLYDEPTSGLDPATGEKVAGLIRETHSRFGKTSIVVTHDYQTLLPIADHVFLFDSNARKIIEVPREQWPRLGELIYQVAIAKEQLATAPPTSSSSLARLAFLVASLFSRTTDAVLAGLWALVSLVPTWRNPRWGLRFVAHYAGQIFGPTAIIYLLIAGFINGYVTTFFTFQFFPFALYTEPLLIEDLLQAIGFTLYRVFVPILSCILIAARCGAAVTADVGGRQYGSQLDAMRTFNASPNRYLLTAIMLGFLVGTPLLNFVSYLAAVAASLLSFVWSHPERGPDFWDYNFFLKLRQINSFWFVGAEWLFAKLVCSGLGIGAIAYYQGRYPKYSTSDVSRSVTNTILWATLYVLIVHFVFALYEFESLRPKPIE